MTGVLAGKPKIQVLKKSLQYIMDDITDAGLMFFISLHWNCGARRDTQHFIAKLILQHPFVFAEHEKNGETWDLMGMSMEKTSCIVRESNQQVNVPHNI